MTPPPHTHCENLLNLSPPHFIITPPPPPHFTDTEQKILTGHIRQPKFQTIPQTRHDYGVKEH